MNENTNFYLNQYLQQVRFGPNDMRKNAYHFFLGYINALRVSGVVSHDEAACFCEMALTAITYGHAE
ncbi:hypothetical protein GCM10007421_22390 [Halopseudomonas oceani]|uniref:Uncharacterized protein n=1 Tax=Halopseudomonas oceani TaxID=1708783 RepID=A0A2P4ET14_9GAMM|nr:hypothetical protein [Halopseudomonas oceani]POB02418.1 hypothetical protein C1949_13305 [Halopseudomonas oceani]GGE47651.1 hypothetical protein GCM10007421_22390 [Halopseudomonas oceani]